MPSMLVLGRTYKMSLLIYLLLLFVFGKANFQLIILGVAVWFGHLIWWAGIDGNKKD